MGKELTSWLSASVVLLYAVLIFLCSFSVWCLGKDVEFDCVGSGLLPFHLLFETDDYCLSHVLAKLISTLVYVRYRSWRSYMIEGLDGGFWNSLISKNLTHYSLSSKFLLIL